eukprot:scaffold94853_cov35-Prasinocladus_malaysianus.AAC.1
MHLCGSGVQTSGISIDRCEGRLHYIWDPQRSSRCLLGSRPGMGHSAGDDSAIIRGESGPMDQQCTSRCPSDQ